VSGNSARTRSVWAADPFDQRATLHPSDPDTTTQQAGQPYLTKERWAYECRLRGYPHPEYAMTKEEYERATNADR
jgi:hypothetical protein